MEVANTSQHDMSARGDTPASWILRDVHQVRRIKVLLRGPPSQTDHPAPGDLPSTLEIHGSLLLKNNPRNILGSAGRNSVIQFVILIFQSTHYQGHAGETQARLAHLPG